MTRARRSYLSWIDFRNFVERSLGNQGGMYGWHYKPVTHSSKVTLLEIDEYREAVNSACDKAIALIKKQPKTLDCCKIAEADAQRAVADDKKRLRKLMRLANAGDRDAIRALRLEVDD